MMLEDMSLTDYLAAEFELRERQRKEHMKHEEFKRYCTENNYVPLTTEMYSQAIKAMDALEQIRAELEQLSGQMGTGEYNPFIPTKEVLQIIDKYIGRKERENG